MAGVIFDSAISGAGEFDNGSTFTIDHLAVTVTTRGDFTNAPHPESDDFLLRVGFVAIGFDLDEGAGAFTFWEEPKWINWTHSLIGNFVPAEIFAQKVRWGLSVGTLAHLVVVAG